MTDNKYWNGWYRKNREKQCDYKRNYRQFNGFNRTWDKNNKEKLKAQWAVQNAVRDKRLRKEPCQTCGKEDLVCGHHDDYDKPLEVKWLCPLHHKEIHNKAIKISE